MVRVPQGKFLGVRFVVVVGIIVVVVVIGVFFEESTVRWERGAVTMIRRSDFLRTNVKDSIFATVTSSHAISPTAFLIFRFSFNHDVCACVQYSNGISCTLDLTENTERKKHTKNKQNKIKV